MKTSSHSIERKDKIIGNPKTCKRWLVWFRVYVSYVGVDYTFKAQECCGSNAWYPIRNNIGLDFIDKNLQSSNAYKYKPIYAIAYRVWEGSILNGKYITEIKFI